MLLSLPGPHGRLAARGLGERGDDRARSPTAAALQGSAGTAPVTRASGTLRVVAARFACQRWLRPALLPRALGALRRSPWARAFDDARRAAGPAHHQALRARAHRRLAVLDQLLATGQRYAEAVHRPNRARAGATAVA